MMLKLKKSDRNILNKRDFHLQPPHRTGDNKTGVSRRNKSFHHNENVCPRRLSVSNHNKSCPNINQVCSEDSNKNVGSLASNYNMKPSLEMIDNVDDFTTNLFLENLDESNFDLVSINFYCL